MIKISILVGGRFHAFDLAEQLQKYNCLHQLVTSYPRWKVLKSFNIEKRRIVTIVLKELIERFIITIKCEKFFNKFLFYLNKYFEYFASKKIDYKNINIVIGWSGFSYKTFEKAKSYNILKILERGSSHIKFQTEILKEEYEKFGQKIKIDNRVLEQELKEYDLADYISIPSQFVKNTFINKGIPENKLTLIPYGVSLNSFYPSQKKDRIFRFISAGSVSLRKGSIYTLKAFHELNFPDAELLMVGKIDLEMFPLINKFKLNKKIKFINHVPQNKLVDYYNKSDVFIISSIEDGFAMVILQALACGIPVICSNNSGGSELIKNGENGFVLQIRDVNGIKEKMLMFYENQKILNTFKKKIQSDRINISWDIYGKKIISNCKKLLLYR
jgi:glycosyltransferase involved in cell wall biosynthesis